MDDEYIALITQGEGMMDKVFLNDMMAKLFAATGYSLPEAEQLPNGRDFRVVAIRDGKRAEALGRTPLDGAEKLLRVITRP